MLDRIESITRVYAGKVELETASGDHLRFIPGALARSMVSAGSAHVHNANGKVKSVRLIQSAATHLQRIGEPTGDWRTPRFVVREKLDSGGVVWRHHRRCFDE